MRNIIGEIAIIMREKFTKDKALSILNWLETPEEAQELLDWISQQNIETLTAMEISDKIEEIQKK